MARLPQRGRRLLEQLRLVAADASNAELLAGRALGALQAAIPFDEGAVFAVDPGSLVFDRLLAYHGEDEDGLRDWIRDVYLVAREPPPLHFPTLLAQGGGVAVYHELAERWLRASPPGVSQRELRAAWRLWDSPPGGVVRYGLAHRRRWIAALQLARLETGHGFRPGELEMLDRAAPTLAAALARHLAPRSRVDAPPPGQLTFDYTRRLVSLSASGEAWLRLLDDGGAVPVAVQALVSDLAGSERATARLHTVDRHGGRVVLHAERALHLDREVTSGYAVSVASAHAFDDSVLTGAQWAVAQAIARGLSDREAATELHVSPATVHEHVAALHRVLGTSTRPRLVAELAAALRKE